MQVGSEKDSMRQKRRKEKREEKRRGEYTVVCTVLQRMAGHCIIRIIVIVIFNIIVKTIADFTVNVNVIIVVNVVVIDVATEARPEAFSCLYLPYQYHYSYSVIVTQNCFSDYHHHPNSICIHYKHTIQL